MNSLVPSSTVAALGRVAGLPLSAYRGAHVADCVARGMVSLGVATPHALVGRMQHDAHARKAFRRSLTVPVTSMFRDEGEFATLERELPSLLADRAALAVWSAGCATGEELRSVAIVLDRVGALADSRLVGTDVLEETLAVARAATSASEIRYEQRDLVLDAPPAGLFDLVLCRNVAIYFEPAAQARVHAKLAGSLRQGGLLMLGRSETLAAPQRLGLDAVTRHLFRRVS